jgi:hypothetical protein
VDFHQLRVAKPGRRLMDEVDKELVKMIHETKKASKDWAKGAAQVASAVGIVASFQRAGVDLNALLREIRLPDEEHARGDDIVLDAKAFLGRIGT